MLKKRTINLGIIFLVSIFLISLLSASFCCERTKAGAWCSSVENEAECDVTNNYNSVATSCDATSYCRTGTCIDNNEGVCMPNTAQRTCDDEGGSWNQAAVSNIEQCQLGCCLIGEQAAFVTQVRCEKLASDTGQESNYRADVTDEMVCLASANPSEKGACVFTNANNQRDCDMITREECQSRTTTTSEPTETPGFFERFFGGGAEETPALTELGINFYAGFLCSAEELNTICGPRGGTECGEDGRVYFKDTCGELGNVYDNSKLNNDDYWTHIREPSCDDGSGSKGSATCGDCDYLSGSICSPKKVGEAVSYGNSICRNLDCVSYTNADEGFSGSNHPKHGERWCAKSSGVGTITATTIGEATSFTGGANPLTNNLPGSKYYVKVCSNSEVTIEPCEEFRSQVCVESDLDNTAATFKYAKCKTQVPLQCYSQNNSANCENRELRDCRWMETGYAFTENGLVRKNETDEIKNNPLVPNGVCVPLYAPGFDRTSSDSSKNGAEICPIADSYCVVTYKLPVGYRGKQLNELTLEQKKQFCTNNCHCLEPEWALGMNSICSALGDCGTKNNLLGKAGEQREVILIEAANTTA